MYLELLNHLPPFSLRPWNRIGGLCTGRSGYLENWGSGAKRIVDLYREHGIPVPIWVDNHGFISICFFKSNEAYLHNVIKDVIKDTTITASQLAKKCNVTERTIMRDIDVLQKAGILHREGGRKDGQWVVGA